MSETRVTVVGAGLAGSEAAWQLVRKGIPVTIVEMKPDHQTPAHHTEYFAELVCSNSFRGSRLSSAVGLLKEEMRCMDSLIMRCADDNQVPAGGENFINVVESLVVTAPSYYRVIAGSWLAKGVNDADFYGFTLAEDGSAKSINNLTFRAKEWVLDGEELVLTGEADSTGTVVSRTVVYKIDRLDADSLILSNKETGAVEWACGRESE